MEKSERRNPHLQAAIIEVVEKTSFAMMILLKQGRPSNVSLKPVILKKRQND